MKKILYLLFFLFGCLQEGARVQVKRALNFKQLYADAMLCSYHLILDLLSTSPLPFVARLVSAIPLAHTHVVSESKTTIRPINNTALYLVLQVVQTLIL
ncbi:MAG: hypothetical protein IPM69_12045 [Ignavibacteria bacterium]|nr:hypothetical protein [Ignavibacteria bacterium]